jgi:predicted nucleic acid-binding protein
VTTPESIDNIPSQGLRVVCDTNVLVSAVMFPQSVPGRAFTHARHAGKLLTTPELASELRDVLLRPKMSRYITGDLRDEFLAAYLAMAEFVVTTEQITA